MDDLYFVRAGEFVKIGRTKNIDQRLIAIQTGCPFGISGAFHFPRMGKLEKELHGSLYDERVNGEWFRWGEAAERQLNEIRRRAFTTAAALEWLDSLEHQRGREAICPNERTSHDPHPTL